MATILGASGSDTVTGSAGVIDTVDYSAFAKGVDVNLAAGTSTVVTATSGHITGAASMIDGENGFSAFALLNAGTTLTATNAYNTLNGTTHTFMSEFDGMGAMSLDATTVRVFINHELLPTEGSSYLIDAGGGNTLSLTGTRIDYVDIDKTTFAIKGSGLAYDTIHDVTGAVVSSAAQIASLTQGATSAGLTRFCSGTLFEPNAFGAGTGLGDRMYFAGQEGNGMPFMLDVATGELWAVGAFGNGAYENAAQLNTGDPTKVAFMLDSDRQDAPMLLYVGTKHAGGDFLDRNGLRDGQLYYWKADNGDTDQTQFTTGTRTGTWVAIDVKDGLGNYKAAATIISEAATGGGFKFNRPEDNSTADGVTVAFNTTGGGTTGTANDPGGAILTMQFDFTNINAPKGTAKVIYDGDTDPNHAIRNPDNMVWSADGFIYVQENRANAANWSPTTGTNTNDASILKLDPATGAVTRVAEVDKGAIPTGFVDATTATLGTWETSGIIDVSSLFGKAAGTLFLSNVMAGNITTGSATTGLAEQDSQLVLIAKPGAGITPAVDIDTFISIENVTGTNLADKISGNAVDNKIMGLSGTDLLAGLGGNDTIDGGFSNDTITGGAGNDTLLGGSSDDRLFGEIGNDKLDGGTGNDRMDGGEGNDTFIVDSSLDILLDASGIDTIQTSLSRTLATGFENLTLTGTAATGIGNTVANLINGNTANNNLQGLAGNDTIAGGSGNDSIDGGTGNDRLDGGVGNDTFIVDSLSDVLVDSSGIDTVQTALSFTLATGFENLMLTGAGAVNGTGNTVANTITGNGAANTLKGLAGNDTISGGVGNDKLYGGLGLDKLTGGTGGDAFVFDAALASSSDTITDFAHLTDKIHLSKLIFTKIVGSANTTLTSAQFFAGTAAHDADDRIIYNKLTGAISYDADGTGATAAVQIAILSTKPAIITNADFLLIV